MKPTLSPILGPAGGTTGRGAVGGGGTETEERGAGTFGCAATGGATETGSGLAGAEWDCGCEADGTSTEAVMGAEPEATKTSTRAGSGCISGSRGTSTMTTGGGAGASLMTWITGSATAADFSLKSRSDTEAEPE